MQFVNYNGKLISSDTAIVTANSPGLQYGDGIFETIRCFDSKLIFFDEHIIRLQNGIQLLGLKIPPHFTPSFIKKEILELINNNGDKNARIRLQVTRNISSDDDALYMIACTKLEASASLNEKGLQLCIYRDAKKSCDAFSNIKHCNYLPYLLCSRFAKSQQCDDGLLLNQYNRICESSRANVFVIRDRNIYTPSLTEGCIAGVYRNFLLKHLSDIGLSVKESKIDEDFMLDADEVFLTNVIRNIKWVGSIGEKKYSNELIKEICNSISI